jgi:hypothetical protein
MIDHNLIIKTIANIQQSSDNKEDLNLPWAYGLSNMLPAEMIDKLNEYYDINTNNSSAWKKEPQSDSMEEMDGDCGCGDSSTRRALIWAPDTVIEEIHHAFEGLTPYIEKVWGKELVFHSVNPWEDSPGFKMDPHIDNDAIGVTIQVYVNDCDQDVGTEFFDADNNLLHKLPWYKNRGYMCNNTPDSWHGMTVQNKILRRSIYAIYSNKI